MDTKDLIEQYNTLALEMLKDTKKESTEKWDKLHRLKRLGKKIDRIMELEGEKWH